MPTRCPDKQAWLTQEDLWFWDPENDSLRCTYDAPRVTRNRLTLKLMKRNLQASHPRRSPSNTFMAICFCKLGGGKILWPWLLWLLKIAAPFYWLPLGHTSPPFGWLWRSHGHFWDLAKSNWNQRYLYFGLRDIYQFINCMDSLVTAGCSQVGTVSSNIPTAHWAGPPGVEMQRLGSRGPISVWGCPAVSGTGGSVGQRRKIKMWDRQSQHRLIRSWPGKKCFQPSSLYNYRHI